MESYARRTGGFAVSLKPDQTSEGIDWVELLANGLTFDLTNLAPGAAADQWEYGHFFSLPADFDIDELEAIVIAPGPHMASARPMVPIVRCLAWLAAQLAQIDEVSAIGWGPARTCCSPRYFRDGVMRWLGGGAFPGLGLTALVALENGDMQSEGLALFTGQELRLDAGLASDHAEASKIALRLMHWIAEIGTVEEAISLAGPTGEDIVLEPLPGQRIVLARKLAR